MRALAAFASRPCVRIAAVVAMAGGFAAAGPSRADVTVQQQMTINAAGIKINTTSTERTTADKQRKDSETRCGGLLALLCRDTRTAEIIRLDRQLDWQLQPKKRSYLETPFPTPEERAQAEQKLQETLQRMQQCPQLQPQGSAQPAADTSQCDLSPPKLQVTQTDEQATLAGHPTRRSTVSVSRTCTDRKTGDVCELTYGFDVWLTQDDIPALAQQQAFTRAYLKAQGLDENSPELRGAAQMVLAQYGPMLKQLSANASSLKGYPLRTVFSFTIGGPNCGRARQAQQSAANTRSGGGGIGRLAADAVGGKLSGLFSRHGFGGRASSEAGELGSQAVSNAAGAAASGGASAGGAAASAQSVQLMSMTIETTSIDTSPVGADQFEIPAGWTRETPPPAKTGEFSCPVANR